MAKETDQSAVYLPEALHAEVFRLLGKAADECGLRLYVIGGYVRDYLLGRPGKDIDVVALGNGLEAAETFARISGGAKVAVYENFGTALVRFQDYEIEFVGARRESYRAHSRKPLVENASQYEDQLRRDFTINALALALNSEHYGELVDPFGGVQHLRQQILQTPTDPNLTFSDDPLRMLRAARFAAVLEFEPAQEILDAMRLNQERMDIVSQERITEELNKLMMARKPSVGYKILFNTGLLHRIFPELVLLQGVERRNGVGHKDNFYHTLRVLDNLAATSDNLWLRWAALLHDIAKPQTKRFHPSVGWTFHGHEDKGARMTPKLFRRLRLPQNDKMKYVQKLVRLHLRPIALVDEGVTDSAIRRLIVDAGDDFEDLMLLCRADITTRDKRKAAGYLKNFDQVEQRVSEVEELDRLRNWQPPVTGDMIMEAFALKPGPEVGQIKNRLREAVLEGEAPNEFEPLYRYMLQVGREVLQQEPVYSLLEQ